MSKIAPARPAIIQVLSYYPPHLGGMEKVADQIVEGLVDKGYAVSVYTSDIGYSREVDISSNKQVHYLKSIEFAHTPIMFTLFFRLLILPRHAIMHLHIAHALSPEVVYLISKLRGIPYVAHIHLDVDPTGSLGFLLGTYKKVFLKRVLRSAAKIICLSEPQKKLIAMKYGLPLESIVVIPNGVGKDYFIGEKTYNNAIPRLLFVGRLAAQKNLPLLIEAISHMRTDVLVDIVGEGEERENLKALIHKYKLQNVKLHGKKTGKELINLYKSADIFVLPSLKEGMSLAMLEALAAGLPVVATDQPEMRHILGDCGILVQNPTPVNYAKDLDDVLSKKSKLQELSSLAVKRARFYSWASVLDSIEGVYKEVARSD